MKYYLKKAAMMLLMLFWCCITTLSADQNQIKVTSGDKVAEKYRKTVIQISVEFSDGTLGYGFGFVVCEKDNKLYAVTANHVIQPKTPNVKIKEIWAKFYENKGKRFKAEAMDVSSSEHDLALIELEKPFEGYVWEKNCYTTAERGENVWFIGRNRDWYVPVKSGIISEQASPSKPYYKVDISSVQVGTSGAPLFTEKGIIGMITQDDGNEALSLNIEIIKDIVKNWNYPFGETAKNEKMLVSKEDVNKIKETLETLMIGYQKACNDGYKQNNSICNELKNAIKKLDDVLFIIQMSGK